MWSVDSFALDNSILYATNNTQIVIGMLQNYRMAITRSIHTNHFMSPLAERKTTDNILSAKINYDSEYPNGFLDITYPNENRDVDRPTLFYFHGGGFFAGSKNMGDPMAATEATYLLDDICAAGYNIVNVDYALVPDYRFPVPLIQANRAFAYISGT